MIIEPYGQNSLSNFLYYISELVIVADLKGIIIDINYSLEKFLDKNKDNFIGSPLITLTNQLNIKIFKKDALEKILSDLPITNIHCKLIINNEEEKELLWSCIPLLNNKQIISGVILIGKEISKLNKLNADLELLDNIIKYTPDWIYWKDKNSIHLGCNDEFAKAAGFSNHNEMIGKSDYDFPWKDRAEKYIVDDKEVITLGIPKLNIEDTVLVHNGKEVTVISNKVPLRNSTGKVIGILGIATDITYLKEIEKNLKYAKEAAEAAEAASHAKTEFIANMSHDIRTPLTGVIGMSEILENSLENPDQKENAHMLHDSGEQLLSMLNGILDDIRTDHMQECDIHAETFDLYQCIQDLVRLELPTIKHKKLELIVDISSNVPQFIINDSKKIHRILLNLLGNAIKFTQSGNITIAVKCNKTTKSSAHIQFSVADTGIGIPKDFQSHIFERFSRATPSYKGVYEGHGLGLHIAQSYVSLLGGHITVTSKENIGTTFHFDLKCKIGNKNDVKSQTPSITIDKTRVNPKKKAPAAVHESQNKPKNPNLPHLLLVEDSPIALKVLESIVSNAGYQFTSTENGEDAVELAKALDFDLIITDIGLPGISGNKLSLLIRDWEKKQHKKPIPIIGLTGHARDTAKPECLASGMNDVFSKPITLILLQSMIEQFVVPKTQNKPSIYSKNNVNKSGKLGLDLPNTEDELFAIDKFLIFDPTDLLKQVNNNESLMKELLNAFITDKIQQDIHDMISAYNKNDWSEVEKLAHKLKGGASYLGTHRMFYACQYLERYYKAGHRDINLLDKLFQQLIDVNKKTINTIKYWINHYM